MFDILHSSVKEIEFSQVVNLRDFNLDKGTYSLKLIYYQNAVLREIDQWELEADLKEHDAFLFKGCIASSSVKLVVD
ncbi:MAG: hypothetical protein ACKO96_09835 [Flammeovirgaceae bacterium]